jgi:hypothetical protein
LFLGHRTGTLYNGNLYEALKSHTTIAEDLLNLFRHDTLVAQELSKWKLRIQLFASSPTSIKFKECYVFLGRHFSENGVHSTLFGALKPPHIREEDELVAKLIKAEFFDTILTTNFDTLLEDACDLLGMKKPEDYELFIYGPDDSAAIGQSISRYGQIVKVFGDFDSLNYKTVGNEFDLEADQSFKKFLVESVKYFV